MIRRILTAALLLITGLIPIRSSQPGETSDRPNVIFIMADDRLDTGYVK